MPAGPREPVNDDETQAHGHQQEAKHSKTKGLWSEKSGSGLRSGQPPQPMPAHWPPGPSHQDFGCGPCRFLLRGHDAEVEDSREDEDEAWGGCGTCEEQGMATEGSWPPIE